MKKTLFLVSTFLFLSINFLAKSSEQNLLDTLYFEDLIEMKKDAIKSKNLIPKPLRERIFGIYDNKIVIRGSNINSKMNFVFYGKLLNIRDVDLKLNTFDSAPAEMGIIYCEVEECLYQNSSYHGFEEDKIIYIQGYEVMDWSLEHKDNFNIIIKKFGRNICTVFNKSYEEDCKKNLIQIKDDRDYIKLSFDLEDFSFLMGKNETMNARKLIKNNDIKLIPNSKLRYWNLRNPRFDRASVSLETLSKIRKHKIKISKENITNKEENQIKPKLLLKKLLGKN
jgi:hypothetical protein